ncbi:MAG: Tm-1-like ATP-binding domain-containing protein [Bacillota bacterium]|nr:Tm-1-like ATP-binding domain-containing protein [Bacillota bacterium]
MGKAIAVIASLDTKAKEAAYVSEAIRRLGHRPLLIDVGVKGEPLLGADITREAVALAAGESLSTLMKEEKRVRIMAMARGLAALLPFLYAQGRFDAVLSLGGAQNTTMGTAGMRALPLGVPKLMVSTMASGRRTFDPLVGTKDLLLMHSVADVAGINLVTRAVMDNAVAAICGMAEHAGRPLPTPDRTVIGATMLGVTNEGVSQAVSLLEAEGYEVVTFHATGVGGRAMEELIDQGVLKAALDLTLHEIACELFGGYSSGAENRLDAASRAGIPQVVAPGGADVVDYAESALAELPDWQTRKRIYQHPAVLHLKLHPEEAARVAQVIAERLNRSRGPVTVVLPLRGMHQQGFPGGPLWDPEADQALYRTLKENLNPGIVVREVDAHINDPAFSRAAAEALLELLGKGN